MAEKRSLSASREKAIDDTAVDKELYRVDTTANYSVNQGHVGNADQLQRHLGNRQVQLIAIGQWFYNTFCSQKC